MKKTIWFFVSLILAGLIAYTTPSAISTAIAGEYDGFWVIPTYPGSVTFIRHDDKAIILVDLTDEVWEAFWGPISSNSATLSTLLSGVNANFTISFESTDIGTIRINSCRPIQPDAYCTFPAGTILQIKKVF